MLYEKLQIKEMTLANRLVRSATWEGLATPEGFTTKKLEDVMLDLVDGGVGLLITGHMFVHEQGRASERQLGIYSDECLPGLRQMVKNIHAQGGVVVAQLAHAGGEAAHRQSGMPALGPSPFTRRDGEECGTMTEQDINEMVSAFRLAAARAVAAGFDAVQIHSAHGYGLSQFLSPLLNKRNDLYGGSLENRARPLIRVYEAIRETVGENYPVLLKINCRDYIEGGLELEESVSIIQGLAKLGLDAVEISGGLLSNSPATSAVRVGNFDTPAKEAWNREAAVVVKKHSHIPVMLVGGLRSFSVAEGLLADGTIDCVSMSRPLIREPHLANRWANGEFRKAECISCNKCFEVLYKDKGFYCPVAKDDQE